MYNLIENKDFVNLLIERIYVVQEELVPQMVLHIVFSS